MIKINPSSADGYFSKGFVLNEKGDEPGALANYNQVIKLDPEYIDVYIQRAYIRKDKGEKKEAITDLQKAISLLHKESMLDDIGTLQTEIKNTPWWQMQVF